MCRDIVCTVACGVCGVVEMIEVETRRLFRLGPCAPLFTVKEGTMIDHGEVSQKSVWRHPGPCESPARDVQSTGLRESWI